jgi:hypothetical protein
MSHDTNKQKPLHAHLLLGTLFSTEKWGRNVPLKRLLIVNILHYVISWTILIEDLRFAWR